MLKIILSSLVALIGAVAIATQPRNPLYAVTSAIDPLADIVPCFIANLGIGWPRARTPAEGSAHSCLALLLASLTVARTAQAAEGTTTVPGFEPTPCPKLQGVEWLADASYAARHHETVPVFVGRSKSRTSWRDYSGGISLKA